MARTMSEVSQEDDGIEITPEMIEVGVKALANAENRDATNLDEDIVRAILEAALFVNEQG